MDDVLCTNGGFTDMVWLSLFFELDVRHTEGMYVHGMINARMVPPC